MRRCNIDPGWVSASRWYKEALAEQVQILLHSQSDFGASNRARVERLFNAERMADDWIQYYGTMLR